MILRGGSRDCHDPSADYVWQIWPSSGNLILLNGVCLTGSQPLIFCVALVCACLPFYSFVSGRVPGEPISNSFVILCMWFFIVLALMMKISFTDPGIIPRRKLAQRIYSNRSLDLHESEKFIDPYRVDPDAVYCHTCEIMRPSHANHCHDCGNCVVGFDHHCAVLNNCIGQRNYIYFFMLLPCLCVLVVCFIFQVKMPSNDSSQKSQSSSTLYDTLTFISFAISAVALSLVVALLVYHLWLLIYAKTTTKRHVRGKTPLGASFMERLKGHEAHFNLRQRLWEPESLGDIYSP